MAKLTCQRCGGPAYGGRGCITWCLVIGLFPFGLLLLLLPVTYKCRRCGNMFK